MDKSRQQFEEFIKFHMDDAEIKNKFQTANNGLNYADQYVDLMWISWQASRESLINNLEPVGYINPVAQLCIKRKLNAAIKPNKENNSIPLYRLD
ncbi:hypothetical protein [Proteus terrae]|uniref:hypothetical protein n=1 Tax=Proteus terrae TaxID=1574161 RepID=UPI0028729E2E|nr:hypothetical protein [Proteus terrae]MDR9741546.1 hypothetical protein [Proteus terrae]